MSADNNSFGGGYTVQYGAPPSGESAGADNTIKDTTTASFTADVIQESRSQPVLVDFWAPWCGPCKQLAPALEKAVREAGGRVKLVKMNIDDHPAIAGQLGIQSIPAVVAFSNGQPVAGLMGAIPESKIREFIDRVAGPGSAELAAAEALQAADELKAEGDLQGAMQVYAAVLQQDPENLDAIAALADTLVDARNVDGAREVLARVPEGKDNAPQFAAVKAKIAPAEQVAALGDPVELQRRLEQDPNDHQGRFDLALIQNALGDRTQAAESLLAIMKADRSWKDDGARLQLLQFFEAWGMTDPATVAARRKLSSLLFALGGRDI